jgi:HSP20 family protein
MENQARQRGEQKDRDVTENRGRQIARRSDYDPSLYAGGDLFANPFSVMRRMHEDMDRMFSDLLGGRSTGSGFGGGLATWSPAIEVSQRDDQLSVCAELPGLKPEDVKVEVTSDAITIEGERRHEHEENKGGKWHSERSYGHFYRTIPLPEGADAEKIRADFKNGELHVTVPVQQRSENKSRRIPIEAGSSEKK